MIMFLVAAAASAETTNVSTMTGSEGSEIGTIVVEGRRSGDWAMPKLDYDEPASCPVLVETEIPGFGVMRIRKRCALDQTEQWRLHQN